MISDIILFIGAVTERFLYLKIIKKIKKAFFIFYRIINCGLSDEEVNNDGPESANKRINIKINKRINTKINKRIFG